MTATLADKWISDVARGPDWLYVRIRRDDAVAAAEAHLAETICQLLNRHLVHRLVLELDEVDSLRSDILGELVRIHKRVCSQGGIVRLSGLSDANREVLQISRLADRFPAYQSRHDAVMGQPQGPHRRS